MTIETANRQGRGLLGSNNLSALIHQGDQIRNSGSVVVNSQAFIDETRRQQQLRNASPGYGNTSATHDGRRPKPTTIMMENVRGIPQRNNLQPELVA